MMRAPEFRPLVCLLLMMIAPGGQAKFDDTVFLKNGDRIMGDVKELNRDMLKFKTDAMGTVYIRWDDIRSLDTRKSLRIELKSGRRVVGSIGQADAPDQMVVSTRLEDELHYPDELIAFVPLKLQESWLDRLEGSAKFGLNGTKGSNTIQWSIGANALYRGENFEVSSRWDSIITNKTDNTDSQRINFTNSYRRLLADRWFWMVLAGYDKNDELGLSDRWSAGGGYGRFLYRSNRFELVLHGGLLASREFRTDTTNDSLEGYAGGRIAWFQHRFPRTDITSDLIVYPSFTDSGRVRSNLDVAVSREFIEDLWLDLSVYYSTDNQAPEESAREDWGVTTSLKYTF